MGFIREPKGVDFIINSRPLTEKEKAEISEYIRAYKEKHLQKKTAAKKPRRTAKKRLAKA